MKNYLFLLIAFSLSSNTYSQILFENGYYVDNSGKKNNCFIKNVDWRNNPTQFEYKLSLKNNGKVHKGNIETVKEFGITNVSKYVRAKVKIDRSSENVNKLSSDRKPIFEEELLFLKVLVGGTANLYQYEDKNLKRYFYNKTTTPIQQLIYKSFLTENDKVGKNNRFKNQLWNDLNCAKLNIKMVEKLAYKKNDLIYYFSKYNECTNTNYVNFEKKQSRDLFHLNIRPGVNLSNLLIDNSLSKNNTNFESNLTFRVGIEAEFIMPFNKNKWALIIEPTYQYFKSEAESAFGNTTVNYNSIEIPIGIRHYFFLNDNSKIFINSSFVFDINNSSNIDFDTIESLEINTRNNFAVGLGYKYNNKYSVELRYQTPRNVLGDYIFWNSEYRTFSVIFGYSIL